MVSSVAGDFDAEKVFYGMSVVVECAECERRMVVVKSRLHPAICNFLELYLLSVSNNVNKPHISSE